MTERGGFISRKIKEAVEKGVELAKKVDFFLIGSGLIVFVFSPGLGVAIIVGSALTVIPEEKISRWAKKR